jgi:hypothetical protein
MRLGIRLGISAAALDKGAGISPERPEKQSPKHSVPSRKSSQLLVPPWLFTVSG